MPSALSYVRGMARRERGDRGDQRDRGRDRERDRDRDRREVEREPEGGVEARLACLEDRVLATAALANSTAYKVGNESARRSLVFFISGELKAGLERGWNTWKRNSALPPAQRPQERPVPWKLQVYTALVEYAQGACTGSLGNMPPGAEAAMRLLLPSSVAVEAVQHGDPQDGKPWPVVVLFRNSETAQNTRDVWLQNVLRPLFGKDKDLGLRPARYLASGVHRRVHDFVPAKERVKGRAARRSGSQRRVMSVVMVPDAECDEDRMFLGRYR